MLRVLVTRWAKQLWVRSTQRASTAFEVSPLVRWSILPLGLAAAAISTPLFTEPDAAANPTEVLRSTDQCYPHSVAAQSAAAKEEKEQAILQQLLALVPPHPPAALTGDPGFLLQFIRARPSSRSEAEALLVKYCAFLEEYHWDRTPEPSVQRAIETGVFGTCGRATNGSRVVRMMPGRIVRLGGTSDMQVYQHASYCIAESLARRDLVAQNHGLVLVVDFSGFSSASAIRSHVG